MTPDTDLLAAGVIAYKGNPNLPDPHSPGLQWLHTPMKRVIAALRPLILAEAEAARGPWHVVRLSCGHRCFDDEATYGCPQCRQIAKARADEDEKIATAIEARAATARSQAAAHSGLVAAKYWEVAEAYAAAARIARNGGTADARP